MEIKDKLAQKGENFLFKYLSLAVVIICAMYYYFSRGYVSVIKDFLMDSAYVAIPLTATEFSRLSSAFSLAYGLGQPIGGYLMDKYGLNIVYPIMLLGAAISTYIFALSSNLDFSVYSRYFLGFFFSISSTGSYRYISIAFKQHFSLLSNVLVVCMSIAAAFASSHFIKESMLSIGWNVFLQIYAVIGILLATCVFFVMKRKKSDAKNDYQNLPDDTESFSFKNGLKAIIALRGYFKVAIFMLALSSASYVLMEGWGNNLFYEKYSNLGLVDYSLPSVFNMYGNSAGYFYNIFGNRMSIKKQMIVYSFIGIVSVSGIIFFDLGQYFFIICCFFVGFTGASQNVAFVFLKENLQEKYLGLAFGLTNFICMYFGCALMQKMAGFLLDFHKKYTISKIGTVYEGYSVSNLGVLFKVLLVVCLIALFASLVFKEKKSSHKPTV